MKKVNNLADKYWLRDCPQASLIGSRLYNILIRLDKTNTIFDINKEYLQSNNFQALLNLSNGNLTFDEYLLLAKKEYSQRKNSKTKMTLQEVPRPEILSYEEKKKISDAYFQRPKYQQDKINTLITNLLKKYDISFLNNRPNLFKNKIINILKKIDQSIRLEEEEYVFLLTEGKYFYSDSLKKAFHKIEADFFLNKFKKNQNYHDLIQSSSHYRKAKEAKKIIKTLEFESKHINKQSKKIQSAYFTTFGGVHRDLHQHEQAIELALKAHDLDKQNFRPCTLLGALYMDLRNWAKGQSWYDEAIKRGARPNDINNEIYSIFKRLNLKHQNELLIHLKNNDLTTYNYIQSKNSKQKAINGKNQKVI